MCSINSSSSLWANIYCSVTHPFKCSGQLLWQLAQTGDEIRAGAVALRESLSICLLTPPFSLCMEEAAREAAHKQQRWLTLAPSPRADHHHAELTVPPITAESDRDEGDNVETYQTVSVLDIFLCSQFGNLRCFLHKKIVFTRRFTFISFKYTHSHSFFFPIFKPENRIMILLFSQSRDAIFSFECDFL